MSKKLKWLALSILLLWASNAFAQNWIKRDTTHHIIRLSAQNNNILLYINYANSCYISKLVVKDTNVLSPSGAYTGVNFGENIYTSKQLISQPIITIKANELSISNISYGDSIINIEEKWTFKHLKDKITWKISRQYPRHLQLENMSFPKWNFSSMSTWKGGVIDNGGMVWCKYLTGVDDTYGVHTGGTVFWNAQSGIGLSIQGKGLDGNYIATQYSHSEQGEFTCTQAVADEPFQQRYHLNRFVRGKPDVFAPVSVKGKASALFSIKYLNYFKTYDRGNLKHIDAAAVRELMNTTARYGVVDNNIVGGNGWLSNWKCLHEPFFGQIALALDDSNYTQNLANTLDQERDEAMLPSGRVLSRWHNEPGDEMPGTYNKNTGYYEAKWGYTIDSQTGYIINACDLFNLTGDLSWLKHHQESCEKALNWLIRRDSNHNGIFEMKNKNISEHTSSDWLDIIWASFENAFVNAQMYAALEKWSLCEKVLGNIKAATYYKKVALRLKTAFNKPVEDGGFWSARKKQYIYWRDDDGSIHGDNLVTPVQFMTIASGICDDQNRIKLVLDQIEKRMSAEHLFHWPLCFDSFKPDEAASSNFPFPKYENGDIFPTWGYLGIASYVKYNKDLALKYIVNLLNQYQKDGLSSQRYSRISQQGQGSDVLAGICTSITALYSEVYGIQPQWNRFVLNPHLVPKLYGTHFHYWLRGINYEVLLNKNFYKLSTKQFAVAYHKSFGVSSTKNRLIFYPGNQDSIALHIQKTDEAPILLRVKTWNADSISFKLATAGNYAIELHGLQNHTAYDVLAGGKIKNIKADEKGTLLFDKSLNKAQTISIIRKRH